MPMCVLGINGHHLVIWRLSSAEKFVCVCVGGWGATCSIGRGADAVHELAWQIQLRSLPPGCSLFLGEQKGLVFVHVGSLKTLSVNSTSSSGLFKDNMLL